MTLERPQSPTAVMPIASMDDPRVIQILSTEHWSLLGARSLAYNEAFVRAGMFLTFLSMSFVALALVAQAMPFDRSFLSVAALVLAFDLVIGLTTFLRMNGANLDDLRANHGMARRRHGRRRADDRRGDALRRGRRRDNLDRAGGRVIVLAGLFA